MKNHHDDHHEKSPLNHHRILESPWNPKKTSGFSTFLLNVFSSSTFPRTPSAGQLVVSRGTSIAGAGVQRQQLILRAGPGPGPHGPSGNFQKGDFMLILWDFMLVSVGIWCWFYGILCWFQWGFDVDFMGFYVGFSGDLMLILWDFMVISVGIWCWFYGILWWFQWGFDVDFMGFDGGFSGDLMLILCDFSWDFTKKNGDLTNLTARTCVGFS